MLCDNQAGVGVELHTALLPAAYSTLLPSDWFYRGTDPHLFGNLQVRLPNATRSVGHIVAHAQLGHSHYWRGKVELRQLLDLAIIRKKYENAIDWMELDHRFSGVPLGGKMLATYLDLANKLLGQAMPRLRLAGRVGEMAELRWRSDPSGWTPWGRLSLMVINYIADRRRDPRGTLRLLSPAKWTSRMGRVVSMFKRHEPLW